MHYYGISLIVLECLNDNLTNRTRYVSKTDVLYAKLVVLRYHFIYKIYLLQSTKYVLIIHDMQKNHLFSHNDNVRVFNITVFGVKLYNDLSLDFTNRPTNANFKRKYKTFLINN